MDAAITADAARRMRWNAQLLGGSELTPAQVVDRAVALQGQDLGSVLRAIALRSQPGTTLDDVRAAFDAGQIVRSWPMRGTLFATTPRHLATLLAVTAERTHRSAARRREELGVDAATIDRASDIAREMLSEQPLTRAQIIAAWEAAGIPATGGRGYHLLMHLTVAGLTWWGAFADSGREQLLTLAELPKVEGVDAALAALVRRYVAAREPVTLDDLAWWTKLPKTMLRRGVADADLTEVSVDGMGAPAWVVSEPRELDPTGVALVPGFDEWILGYGDRSLTASEAMQRELVPGNNGVFRPAVLVDGVTVGTWRPRPSRQGERVSLVEKVSVRTRRAIDAAVEAWPYD